MAKKREKIKLNPIGYVKIEGNEPMISKYNIKVLKSFRPALKELDKFSHVMVFWWAHQNDDTRIRNSKQVLTTVPPYGENTPETGIFSTRSEFRPNPLALTTCKILNLNLQNGILEVAGIDAIDGSPVVDLKAYFPICDRIRDCYIAPWLKDWPEWQEEGVEWWIEQGFFDKDGK